MLRVHISLHHLEDHQRQTICLGDQQCLLNYCQKRETSDTAGCLLFVCTQSGPI